MGSLQDFLKVQFGGLILLVQENIYKLKTKLQFMPGWQKFLLYLFIFLLIPGYFLMRFGSEIYFSNNYARESLAAHPSYSDPENLQQTKVTIVRNANGTSSAYAVITNNNLDLAIDNLNYTFTFLNSRGEEVGRSNGQTYILPNQKKWIVVPRIQSIESIASSKLTIDKPSWQKRLEVPELELKMSEPYVYEQVNPLATVTEGTIVNNSPYKLKQASMVLVLYDANNKVLAITTREESALDPYERRAYKIQWPGIYQSQITRIGLEAYTNSLDPDNLTVEANNEVNNLIEPN
jgi:archaellum component FlaF (FlaF/FlaG flagellin family)